MYAYLFIEAFNQSIIEYSPVLIFSKLGKNEHLRYNIIIKCHLKHCENLCSKLLLWAVMFKHLLVKVAKSETYSSKQIRRLGLFTCHMMFSFQWKRVLNYDVMYINKCSNVIKKLLCARKPDCICFQQITVRYFYLYI